MSNLPRVIFGPEIWSLQNEGGISRYFLELINGLSERGIDGEVLTQNNVNSRINGANFERFHKHELGKSSNPYSKISEYLSHVSDVKIFHPTYYSKNLVEIREPKTKVVVTVFDMISELFPEKKPRFRRVTDEKKISVHKADHILSISEQTKVDLMKIYDIPSEKITVTYLGTNLNAVRRIEFAELGRTPYLLYVGKRGGYKNFKNFITAYSQSKDLKLNFSVVAVGGGDFSSSEILQLQNLGILDRVTQINADDEHLAMYYRNAACLVYPSLYEGFGLPPVEAMSLGCVVIASLNGSIPEICSDAAVFFDPLDVDSISDRLFKTLNDEELLSSMRQKGFEVAKKFTWEKTAVTTLDSYLKIASS